VAHQGEVLKNPVTGQNLVFRRTTAETAGELLEVESSWAPGGDGHVNERGMPGLLQSAVLMNEYSDEFRLATPAYGVQRALFGVLAPLGRALGRPTRYPTTR
jgi:hypothetical protein